MKRTAYQVICFSGFICNSRNHIRTDIKMRLTASLCQKNNTKQNKAFINQILNQASIVQGVQPLRTAH